jgi:hypothetical protein
LDIHIPFANTVAAAGAGIEVAAEDEVSGGLVRGRLGFFVLVFDLGIEWIGKGERKMNIHQSRA